MNYQHLTIVNPVITLTEIAQRDGNRPQAIARCGDTALVWSPTDDAPDLIDAFADELHELAAQTRTKLAAMVGPATGAAALSASEPALGKRGHIRTWFAGGIVSGLRWGYEVQLDDGPLGAQFGGWESTEAEARAAAAKRFADRPTAAA